MENADEFDSECSEYVTFAPSVLLLDGSETAAQRSATVWCIQVHYFRSVDCRAAAARAVTVLPIRRRRRRRLLTAGRRSDCLTIINSHFIEGQYHFPLTHTS